MDSRADTDHEGTVHDTSYAPNPHDRSTFTYASSYTDYGHHHRSASQPYTGQNASYVDPTSQSYLSVPAVRIVEVEPAVQMFPSKGKASLILSIVFTFVCCFACAIPAVVLSKQVRDFEKEGEKGLAASLANQVAFWLILSLVCGILCWTGWAVLMYAYRF